MSNWYFITPYDPKAWKDPDDMREKPTSSLKIESRIFQAALWEHWGPDRIKADNDTAILRNVWELINTRGTEEGHLSIYLQDNYQVVTFRPGPRYIEVEFVLWYRKFIPPMYPLYFFNSSSWERLLLTADTKDEDIIGFIDPLG